MNRRSFLKGGAASAAVPLGRSPSSRLSVKKLFSSEPAEAAGVPASERESILPGIPKSKDLAGDRLVYDYSDSFGPPTAQNEAGFCQATKSVSGINESRERRKVSLGFDLRAGVTYKEGPWYGPWNMGDPAEVDNRLTVSVSQGLYNFEQRSPPDSVTLGSICLPWESGER